jgi:hypothetical protein
MLDTMGPLEHAKAKRQRAARIRESAKEYKRLSDRLQALENAVELDRQAEVLEDQAAGQIAEPAI